MNVMTQIFGPHYAQQKLALNSLIARNHVLEKNLTDLKDWIEDEGQEYPYKWESIDPRDEWSPEDEL